MDSIVSIDGLRAQAALDNIAPHLYADLDVDDVADELVNLQVLSEHDVDQVLEHTSTNDRVTQLMLFLSVSPNKIDEFIKAIRKKYPWIANEYNAKIAPSQLDEFQNEIYKLQMQNIPFIANNVHRLRYMFIVHQHLIRLKPAHCLILTGRIGIGKQWLLIDTCCRYSVLKVMERIFYINLRNCKSEVEILGRLQQLFYSVLPTQPLPPNYDEDINIKINTVKEALINHFKRLPNSLLILADIQSPETLTKFQLGCKTVMTTRDKMLKDKWPSHVHIEISDGFTLDESLSVFKRVLKTDTSALPAEAETLHTLCSGHPFVLAEIGAQIAKFRQVGVVRCWNMCVDVLNQNETSHHYPHIRQAIKQSLDDLPTDEAELFNTFVIFTDTARIPLSLLEKFWDKKLHEVNHIVVKFERLFLVSIQSYSRYSRLYCSVQYLYSSYLSNAITDAQKQYLHRQLVMSYKITEAIESRTEPNLSFPTDGYFYYFIAYHLSEAQMFDTLQTLYLDFGFLEQKIRATGLSNTIGDLELYREHIANNSDYRTTVLNELLSFLPNVEEMLIRSNDTCLLQYALMNNGPLQLEADRQVAAFPNRLFFDGSDHVQRRWILPQNNKPYFCRFRDLDQILLASADHSIRLDDISPGYKCSPIIFEKHSAPICDLQKISESFFISLDKRGECNVWKWETNPTQSPMNTKYIQQNRAESFVKRKTPVQTIVARRANAQFSCITLINKPDNTLSVIFGTSIGSIEAYTWENDNLSSDNIPDSSREGLRTPIHSIVEIARGVLIMLFKNGCLARIFLKDMAPKKLDTQIDSTDTVIGMHVVSDPLSPDPKLLVVFANQVIEVKFDERFHIGNISYTPFHQPPASSNSRITCSALTDDRTLLALGTEQGIIVFDLFLRCVVVQHNVSDSITFTDIRLVAAYKYRLICGMKEETFCYLYEVDTEPAMTEKKWLLGGNQFAVTETDTRSGDLTIAAIDSQGRIFRKYSSDQFEKSESIECGHEASVTALGTYGPTVVVGYADGNVYNDSKQKLVKFPEPVKYVKCFSDVLVIAGTQMSYWISNYKDNFVQSAPIVETYMFHSKYLMVVKEDASFDIWDNTNKNKISTQSLPANHGFGGCDLQGDVFVIASHKEMHFWKINAACELVQFPRHKPTDFNYSMPASCVSLSKHHQFCAVGFTDGHIRLFRLISGRAEAIDDLSSHKSRINALHFSPWSNDDRRPVILASVSEQLCFWNVSHADNNRKLSTYIADLSPSTCNDPPSDDIDSTQSPWIGKSGPTAKPELLSCYKFVGNTAKLLFTNHNFSQFFTIDDVGRIYLLTIRKHAVRDLSIGRSQVERVLEQKSISSNTSSYDSTDSDVNGTDEVGLYTN